MYYETLMESDLRDSGGHVIKVIRITDFNRSYTMGGIVIDPSMFGMNKIEFMHLQAIAAYQDDPSQPAVVASMQTAQKFAQPEGDPYYGYEYWKLFIFIPDPETGVLNQITDGAPLEFPPEMRVVLMLTGS